MTRGGVARGYRENRTGSRGSRSSGLCAGGRVEPGKHGGLTRPAAHRPDTLSQSGRWLQAWGAWGGARVAAEQRGCGGAASVGHRAQRVHAPGASGRLRFDEGEGALGFAEWQGGGQVGSQGLAAARTERHFLAVGFCFPSAWQRENLPMNRRTNRNRSHPTQPLSQKPIDQESQDTQYQHPLINHLQHRKPPTPLTLTPPIHEPPQRQHPIPTHPQLTFPQQKSGTNLYSP